MFAEREVTGNRWMGLFVVVLVVVLAADCSPARTPPVVAAYAPDAHVAIIIRLQTTALTKCFRNSTTSFVGLRG